MKQFLRTGVLMVVACGASVLGARGQIVLYSTDFPDDQGWTFQALNTNAWWAVDETPVGYMSSPSWYSAPYSLNFNNGACYCTPGFTSAMGTATSPTFDLSSAHGSIVLQFFCNIQVVPSLNPCGADDRILTVLNGTTGVFQTCFNDSLCDPQGQWHVHSIPLDSSWGTVRLRFTFDSLGYLNNGGAGWFIDDLSVIGDCAATQGYCTPKLNSLGCSPTIFTTGMPSLSGAGQAFRIWAGGVLNQKVGLMLWSRTPASTPFGGGTLCVAAPITRTAAQNSGGTSQPAQDCTGTYVLQFTPAMMSQAGLVVGDDVYAQYWSRDNGFPPPDNVGLTGGVHWEVCQ
jgi:hypothetical protein